MNWPKWPQLTELYYEKSDRRDEKHRDHPKIAHGPIKNRALWQDELCATNNKRRHRKQRVNWDGLYGIRKRGNVHVSWTQSCRALSSVLSKPLNKVFGSVSGQ